VVAVVLGFLVLSTGLSTIFRGVVTAWQAWEPRHMGLISVGQPAARSGRSMIDDDLSGRPDRESGDDTQAGERLNIVIDCYAHGRARRISTRSGRGRAAIP